jgi:transposase, IS5 family
MADQRSFAGIAWTTKGKQTRRERFLSEMDAVIPWIRLIALVEPHYPKPGRGRPPLGLEKMLSYLLPPALGSISPIRPPRMPSMTAS